MQITTHMSTDQLSILGKVDVTLYQPCTHCTCGMMRSMGMLRKLEGGTTMTKDEVAGLEGCDGIGALR